MAGKAYPVTPDGRYFLVKDRLWRCTDPALSEAERTAQVKRLMQARSLVKTAKSDDELREARKQVQAAKVALGERGPVWWDDGAPDVNRHHPKNTPYADWWRSLPSD
ncbi:MAG: hypothetical protein V7666_12040 [Sulfitobacter sp.]|uniref:hypothetical protein n=1 Tax=unclassified Sulfitobacter TaxID=196795 RepID=UPI001110A445|nr:hypothetical protein [Sulfitobacter sp. BSw21498]|tara:strand:- start:2994 stop:3314 length:321 start_codon:yes stop_codon:yes gene_type:complete